MNDPGSFRYFEADVNEEDPDFVMDGTINVVDQSNSVTSTGSANIGTVGTLMVPTGDLAIHQVGLENAGFTILGTHNFNDIRDGDPQTLIVWGASASGTNLMDDIISQLSQITSNLPYG